MINIALIGAGRMGKCHADVIKEFKDGVISGVFDPDTEAAREFAEKYEVKKITIPLQNFTMIKKLMEFWCVILPTSIFKHYRS